MLFFLAIVTGLVMPGVTMGGPPDMPANGAVGSTYGWMCEQCALGDIWWCPGCLGLTHQDSGYWLFFD